MVDESDRGRRPILNNYFEKGFFQEWSLIEQHLYLNDRMMRIVKSHSNRIALNDGKGKDTKKVTG